MASAEGYRETGIALLVRDQVSWPSDLVRRKPYDMYRLTAAHKTLPLPTWAEVRHLGNGRSIIVRITTVDRFIRIGSSICPGQRRSSSESISPAPDQSEVTAISFDEPAIAAIRPARLPVLLQVGAFGGTSAGRGPWSSGLSGPAWCQSPQDGPEPVPVESGESRLGHWPAPMTRSAWLSASFALGLRPSPICLLREFGSTMKELVTRFTCWSALALTLKSFRPWLPRHRYRRRLHRCQQLHPDGFPFRHSDCPAIT